MNGRTISSASEADNLQENKQQLEKPLPHTFAPYSIAGERLLLLPLTPQHEMSLYDAIFSQPSVMKYFGRGITYTFAEHSALHQERAKQNLLPARHSGTQQIVKFAWTIMTKDGIAGRINITPAEGRTEIIFCLSPAQQGKGLARQAADLVVAYLGNETGYIATCHPNNVASGKTLLQIRFPDGEYVFERDPERQNVIGKFGPDQKRDYFLSPTRKQFSFFSFNRGKVIIDLSLEDQNEKSLPNRNPL